MDRIMGQTADKGQRCTPCSGTPVTRATPTSIAPGYGTATVVGFRPTEALLATVYVDHLLQSDTGADLDSSSARAGPAMSRESH